MTGSTTSADTVSSDTNTLPFNDRALELEEVGPDTYLSVELWKPKTGRGVFGGQVIGQALSAAAKTVESPFRANSLHCYFLAAGNNLEMIAYEIARVRQGRSYCARLVTAKQSGRVIFMAIVSFQRPEQSILDHQYIMPNAPPPESLASRTEYERRMMKRAGRNVDEERLAEHDALPVETRIVPSLPGEKNLPYKMMWLRAKGDMSSLGPLHHQSMLAYATDFGFIGTATKPYRMDLPGTKHKLKMLVSLDHSIWFHEPFQMDEWLLYVTESPRAAGGRGLAIGRVYNRDGILVASTAQEGVVRAKSLVPETQSLEFISKIKHSVSSLQGSHNAKL